MIVTVAVDGIEHSISPTAGDLVRLERQYDLPASQLNEANVRVEHVLFLAWTALRRDHVIDESITFDTFIDLADVPEAGSLRPPAPLPPT